MTDEYSDEESEDEDWKWELTIRKIDNGFLLKGNGFDVLKELAITERSWMDSGRDEHIQQALLGMDLCDTVIEYFALSGSKYDARRVHTILIPGSKFEGDTEFDDKKLNWLYYWLTDHHWCPKCHDHKLVCPDCGVVQSV